MKRNLAVAVVLGAAVAVFYWLAQSWGDILVLSSDAVFVIISGVCSLFAFLVVREWKAKGKLGLVHLGLFLGVVLWFFGELVWAIYEVALGVQVPYPSVADVFYLGGYFPATAAILQFLSFFRKGFTRLRIQAATLLGLVIIGLSYTILINPLLTASSDIVTKTFDLAYPALDTILLVLASLMFIIFGGGQMAKPWLFISFGLLFLSIADIAFSLGTLTEWYYSGHPIELLWLWGYISMAVGFDDQRKHFR